MSELVLENDEISKGWAFAKMKNLANYVNGRAFKPSEWKEKGKPIIRIQNLTGSSNKLHRFSESIEKKYLINDGDLLISWSATLGAYIYHGEPAVLNQHIFKVEPFIDKNFIYYLTLNILDELKQKVHGTGMQHITKGPFENHTILLPPLNEQKRIVEKIEEIFSLISSLKAGINFQIEHLEQLRKSYLFYGFTGKLTIDWRKSNNPSFISDEIEFRKNLRKKQFEEGCKLSKNKKKPKLSEFKIIESNDLPKSWVLMTIEGAASHVVDCPHSTPKFVDKGECCLDTTCIEQSKILWNDIRKVSKKEFEERIVRMPLIENDIVFSREGTIGKSILIPKDVNICLGQRIMMFRFPQFIIPKYAELFLQSPYFQNQYTPLIGGTTSPHLNIRDIKKLKILIPTIVEQRIIIKILSEALSVIEKTKEYLINHLNQLDFLSTLILKQACEGKLVPQDPNDEPASVLLEKIKKEKEQLIQHNPKRGKKNGK